MCRKFLMAPAICLLVTSTPALADLMAGIESASGASGDTFTLDLDWMRTSGTTDMQGFSFGIEVADSSGNVIQDLDTYFNMGQSGLSSSFGGDFNQVQSFDQGFTIGVVFSFTGSWSVDVSSAATIAQLVLVSRESTVGDFTVRYSNAIGAPPTATVGVFGGASLPPSTTTGTLSIQGSTPVVPGLGALAILPAAGLARRRRR